MHRSNTTTLLICLIVAIVPTAAAAQQAIDHNDTAHFLAGLQPSARSPLAALTRAPGWQGEAKSFGAKWAVLEREQLSKIRRWSKANLIEHPRVAHYFFGGPDILYVNAVLPEATTYVLSGLEPVGEIPRIMDLAPEARLRALRCLHESFHIFLNYGYFTTAGIAKMNSICEFSGTLPLVLVLLARAGKQIIEITSLGLNADGTTEANSKDFGSDRRPGVRIVFVGQDRRQRTLFYVSADLADARIKESSFLRFCESFGAGATFLKSASYLLHTDDFSTVREWILSRSALLVQDDSGVPLRYLNRETWNINPFGAYLGSRLIKSTIQVRRRGIPRRGNFAPACRSGLRSA